jgi:carbonic anhydrase
MISPEQLTGMEALQRLRAGNQRFAAGGLIHPNQSPARRAELVDQQHPFAVIFTCSDSRVAPEIIFDQGVGDLYVVRVPGHYLDSRILGSLEYAIEALAIRLVLVVGHQQCGMIKAALEGKQQSVHIDEIIQLLEPSVKYSRRRPVDLVETAVRSNVELTVARLRESDSSIGRLAAENQLLVAGAFYHLSSGEVRMI